MHFILSVNYTALQGDVFAFVHRYLRPRPQISLPVTFHALLIPPTGYKCFILASRVCQAYTLNNPSAFQLF